MDNIKEFISYWQNAEGKELQEANKFWYDLCGLLGVKDYLHALATEYIIRGRKIDIFYEDMGILIENKSRGVNLDKRYERGKTEGGEERLVTPFEQAKWYADNLPRHISPRWVLVCNFDEIRIHDLNDKDPEKNYFTVHLANLEREIHALSFFTDKTNSKLFIEKELSVEAGNIIGSLYGKLIKKYKNIKNDPFEQHSLNVLIVRLVFLLYAENAELLQCDKAFFLYMKSIPPHLWQSALKELFKILDTPEEDRDPYDTNPELAKFPYVNGGLFSDESIIIPQFSEDLREELLTKASCGFRWEDISPTIFGALFESTINPVTRRSGGMHYTSIENIHKVIDPLFLDDLKKDLATFKNAVKGKSLNSKEIALHEFQNKLASIVVLDPAAGSGNFLTESYLSLRRIENEALLEVYGGQQFLGAEDFSPIKVSINQFYGIEINGFAVSVAKTALWIAEHQMRKETKDIIRTSIKMLPLSSNPNIVEANALRVDWNDIVPREKLKYIIGNPPFVGSQLRSPEQSEDMSIVFGSGSPETKLDYVIGWYKKALDLMSNIEDGAIKGSFVSTNSAFQGESVPAFWKKMFAGGFDIGFAYNSFRWITEVKETAAVICVIIGFSKGTYPNEKYIFDEESKTCVNHINAYLLNAPDLWIVNRVNRPPENLPKMIKGSEPTDGGNLFVSSEEKLIFEKKYPEVAKYIKPFVGGDEFINEKQGSFNRYCFWFEHGNPSDYANNREIQERLHNIAKARNASSASRIRARANFPYLFCQIRQPESNYLLFPRHSSSDRQYIPIGFMEKDVIVGDACYIIPDAPLWLFGILTSNIHMAWMRLLCGRIKLDYRYSPAIYNNFPFPQIDDKQKMLIEQTAKEILKVRSLYSSSSLKDLYKDTTMPVELRRAHQNNDKAVLKAYGLKSNISEEAMDLYLINLFLEQKADKKPAAPKKEKERKTSSKTPLPSVTEAEELKVAEAKTEYKADS